MTRSTGSSVATIDQFLQQVGHVKQADAPKSEAGSIGGETSHPVKNVDDRLKEVPKGERFKENTTDVNEDQGAAGVQKAPEAKTAAASIFGLASKFAKKAEGGAVSTPGSAADDHISTTTTVSATGEDPKNETNSAKAGKEDKAQGGRGGTTHPASTENDSLDGHKYAADTPLEKLASDMEKIGNSLLAGLHSVYENSGRQAPQATKQAAAQVGTGGSSHVALQAGHELAGLVNGTFDKRAADAMVRTALTETIKQASDDADLFIEYAHSFFKQAEGEAEDPAAGGGGDPMAAMGGGGAPPGGDPMAAMGGGAEGGGGDPGAMLGALGGGEGAGDPMAGGGGGGGEGGDAEAQQLAAVLEQLGVTPEELQAAMEAEAAGGGGGAPPGGDPMGGGGAPPMGGGGAPPGGGGMETQANAGGRKTNLLPKTAAAEMGNYIRELVSRTRGRK